MVDSGTAAIVASVITQIGTVTAGVFLYRRGFGGIRAEIQTPGDATTGEVIEKIRTELGDQGDELADLRRDVAGVGIALGQHLFDHTHPLPRRNTAR